MKGLIVLFVGLSSVLSAQSWRDSLESARNAYKKGDYAKALDYYEKLDKNKPENVDLSDEMGQSAYKARQFERAEKIYQQGTNGKKSASDKSKSYHNIGNSRLKNKDYDGAIEAYKEALKNNPKSEKTRYNLSEAIRKKEEQKKQNQNQQQNNQNQQQNQNQQNQQNQNQQQGQNQQQNQGQNSQQQQNQQQGQGKSEEEEGGQSQIPNQAAEKMLDDLMKREAETKRRMSGGSSGKSQAKSGKDW